MRQAKSSLLPKDEAEHALREATLAAKRAGDYLRSQLGNAHVAGRKAQRDELLDVDLRAEELILTQLRAAFPTHSVLSEEAGEIAGDPDLCWVVDPLDGSFNFQRGSPLFGIAICLLWKTSPAVSTIYLPHSDELFSAAYGVGARLNGSAIRMSGTTALHDAVVHTGDFSKRGDDATNRERLSIIAKLAGSVGRVRLLGSAAQDFAAVACGRADALVLADTHPWDTQAGALLVAEAVGILSYHSLSEDRPHAYVLAANDRLHPSLAGLIDS
jgi:myo-inositol-1(or 4)-monophosphatase